MRIKYSPVALFAYNRPNHFKSTLNALSKNFLALKTDIYVFCDGPKVETDIAKQTEIKEIVKRATGFKSITLIERGNNLGLAKSIVLGVTEIIHEYGSIIVLEDDIVTSPGFLTYMNDALDLYADDERVMHISGYIYPLGSDLPETFFYRQTSCWGWGTWKRAWKYYEGDAQVLKEKLDIQLQNKFIFNIYGSYDYYDHLVANIDGRLNTWAIKWQSSVFLRNGLALHPKQSLTANIGLDDSGEHSRASDRKFVIEKLASKINVFPIKVEESLEVVGLIRDYNRIAFESDKDVYAGTANQKIISIITTCRNASANLEKTISSIRMQTYPNIEYIVIDAASTDNTIDIIKRNKDTVTKYISESDRGTYYGMNKGIKLSTGEVLFFLNAGDEFIDSSVVSDFMMQFNKEEKISMAFGDINIVNENLGITYRKEQKYISWRYLMMDHICHQSIFFSRDAIFSLGMYDTQYRICADLDLFLKILKRQDLGNVIHLSRVVVNYKLGGLSNPSDKKKQRIIQNEFSNVRKRNLGLCPYYIFEIYKLWQQMKYITKLMVTFPLRLVSIIDVFIALMILKLEGNRIKNRKNSENDYVLLLEVEKDEGAELIKQKINSYRKQYNIAEVIIASPGSDDISIEHIRYLKHVHKKGKFILTRQALDDIKLLRDIGKKSHNIIIATPFEQSLLMSLALPYKIIYVVSRPVTSSPRLLIKLAIRRGLLNKSTILGENSLVDRSLILFGYKV